MEWVQGGFGVAFPSRQADLEKAPFTLCAIGRGAAPIISPFSRRPLQWPPPLAHLGLHRSMLDNVPFPRVLYPCASLFGTLKGLRP